MQSTGIEPVPTPWKGAILPLYYDCVSDGDYLCQIITIHLIRRDLQCILNAFI